MTFFKSIEHFLEVANFEKNKKIVFTNGCFDILHIGHVRYLKKSKELGDILIIGLNSDYSVKHLKGNNRPINKESERAEMLLSFPFVDYVILFNEDTPYHVISKLKPHFLTKGGDYIKSEIIGSDIVESYGGKVVLLPFTEGKSTTNILNYNV